MGVGSARPIVTIEKSAGNGKVGDSEGKNKVKNAAYRHWSVATQKSKDTNAKWGQHVGTRD